MHVAISSSRMIFSLCLADNMWSWLDLGYLISKKGMWGGGKVFLDLGLDDISILLITRGRVLILLSGS